MTAPAPHKRSTLADLDLMPRRRDLIAIGASTGGPPALVRVLKDLPLDLHVPIVVVQHMPPDHMVAFAEFLGRAVPRKVELVRGPTLLSRDVVYIAPGGKHMVVRRAADAALQVAVNTGAREHNCIPAVDPLFRSVAEVVGKRAVIVLLTGMGTDGAAGAKAARDAGAVVVVQDAATSVVWGMPGAAVDAGAATLTAPLDAIGAWIAQLTEAQS